MLRFTRVRFNLLVFLFAAAATLARADWLIESPDTPALSPDAKLVLVTGDRGFTVHDAATLAPRFVVRQTEARPRLFSADGKKLYFSSPREGLFGLDLDTGETSPLAALPFLQALLLDSDSGDLIAFAASPDGWETTALRLHRIDPAGKSAPSPFSEYKPAALRWVELVHVLPARSAGRVLVVLRDADKPENDWDSRKWGEYRFVELDPRTGASTLLSTLPAPREGFFLDNTLRWTSPRRDLLEYASGSYVLVDPYVGKVTRELTVPKVNFALHDEPGQVVALRETTEEDETRHYRDYLESGTLKTIRNVRLASRLARAPAA
jgi:hypothetical protein